MNLLLRYKILLYQILWKVFFNHHDAPQLPLDRDTIRKHVCQENINLKLQLHRFGVKSDTNDY